MIDQGLKSMSVQFPTLSFPFHGTACDVEAPAAQENGPQRPNIRAEWDLKSQEATRDGAWSPSGTWGQQSQMVAILCTPRLTSIWQVFTEHAVLTWPSTRCSGDTARNKSDKIPALMSRTHQPGKTHDREVNKCIHLYIYGFCLFIQ